MSVYLEGLKTKDKARIFSKLIEAMTKKNSVYLTYNNFFNFTLNTDEDGNHQHLDMPNSPFYEQLENALDKILSEEDSNEQ